MSHARNVIKNSIWLTLQPLILNAISIFAMGYIARMLGKDDYGKFVFVFSVIAIFAPLSNLGLRAITVREMAKSQKIDTDFLGKMLVLRIILSVISIILIVVLVNIMNYSTLTKNAVYIMSLSLIFQSITTMFIDIFQAHEQMKYVAYIQFIPGLLITILSVAVLFFGYGLIEVMWVYCFGSFFGLLTSLAYAYKRIIISNLLIDVKFCFENFKKGAPFFLPGLVALASLKIGIVFLSKIGGDIPVGVFGAANNLVEKLIIIPDGICTAVYPAMIILFQKSTEETSLLFKQFYLYLILLGLPISVGTTILAKPIIYFIFGAEYLSSVLVLQILIWWLFVTFLISLSGWTLGAIHQEKKGAKSSLLSSSIFIVLALIFIPLLKENGLALAMLISGLFSFFVFMFYIKKYLVVDRVIEPIIVLKLILINLVMGITVYLLRDKNILVTIVSGIMVYSIAAFISKVISLNDIYSIKNTVRRREEF